jgi:hypothetical protein
MSGLDGLGWPNPKDEPKPKTMSDTPETDAEVNELKSATTYNMVWAEFARKLERERDEAIKAIKSANAYKRVLKNENARLRRMLNLPENDERIRGDADA